MHQSTGSRPAATRASFARENGRLDEYKVALREIDYRLSVEPDEWGESREFLEHIRVQMRCGTSRMVTVLYGVDGPHRSIWVKEFRLNRNYRPRPGGAG